MRFKYTPDHHRNKSAQEKIKENLLHVSRIDAREEDTTFKCIVSNAKRDEEAGQFVRENPEESLQLVEQTAPEQLTDREGRPFGIHKALADEAIRAYLKDPQNNFSQQVGEVLLKEKQDESRNKTNGNVPTSRNVSRDQGKS